MISAKTILVVDDDEALGEMLSIVLDSAGYRSVVCKDGLRAVKIVPTLNPDLILLDVMLPGLNGIAVAKILRQKSQIPIIMLTAKSDTRDVVAGLESGADDYIPKPFKNSELLARIKARLRFANAASLLDKDMSDVTFGSLRISRFEHMVTKNGRDLKLTPLEFDLLLELSLNAGEALTRSLLLKEVWGYSADGDTRLVNVHMQRLRQKVEDDPEHPAIIQTVRGIGYKFVAPQIAQLASATPASATR